MTSLLFDRSAG